tara:strand:- start:4781 stop:5410 length:630 start_codon:yes stop_codon:yes gene_type:complete
MYQQIKFVKPALKLGTEIAVVGSSASLLKNKYGEEIDNYKEVFRFNRAPIKNYESHVGSKTTLRVVNNHVFDNLEISNKGYSNQPKNFVKDLRNQKILYIGPDDKPWKKRYFNTHRSNKLYKFEYSCIREIKEILDIKYDNYLQVGTIIIGLCLLSSLTPTLYGFDLEIKPRTHYFEERPNNINDSSHKIKDEIKLLSDLKEKGKIIVR